MAVRDAAATLSCSLLGCGPPSPAALNACLKSRRRAWPSAALPDTTPACSWLLLRRVHEMVWACVVTRPPNGPDAVPRE